MLETSLRVKLSELEFGRDFAIVNQGIDGDSTRGMLERFNRSVEPEKPDMVLIWGGINDLSSMKKPQDILPNIIELVERTKTIGAVPIVLNVAPVAGTHFNDTVRELNQLSKKYCEESDLMYLDIYSELVDDEGKLPQLYSNDGVHLSDMGYKKIFPLIYQAIMQIVSSLS